MLSCCRISCIAPKSPSRFGKLSGDAVTSVERKSCRMLSVRERTVLYGRELWNNPGELWEWDGASWQQRPSSGPDSLHWMVFDPLRGRSVRCTEFR